MFAPPIVSVMSDCLDPTSDHWVGAMGENDAKRELTMRGKVPAE